MNFMNIRLLQCAEIPLIWHIDRREVVQNIYVLQDGKLVLKPDFPIVFKPLLAGVDI
jgi:predicted N-acetyltransferase YhbS